MPHAERPSISRRAWVATTSGVVAAGLIRTQADAVRLIAQEAPAQTPDPMKLKSLDFA